LRIAGGALLAIGLPWQLYAAGHLVRARAAQRLCIDGPYARCRHPLYAGWILLIVPGALLAATGDPFLLGIPPIMALVFRRLIAHEEDQLAAQFGAPYRAWQARTPLLMPRPGGRPGPPHHQGTTGSGPGAAG
jgi:protein-S-isoprenylcysteine O-methyltransferase Ste14